MPYQDHHHWDVKTFPPTKTAGSAKGLIGRAKARRIGIEVIKKQNGEKVPFRKSLGNTITHLEDDDQVVIRFLSHKGGFKGPLMVAAEKAMDDNEQHYEEEDEEDDPEWKLDRLYHLGAIDGDKIDGDKFTAQFGVGGQREFRKIKFNSIVEAEEFESELQKYRKLLKERASRKKAAFSKSITAGGGGGETQGLLNDSGEVKLLIEIVSASNLPIADLTSTDPYVTVYLGKDKVHKTKHLKKTIDPIWTLETGSLFLLKVSADTFFSAADGLKFVVKDYDSVSANDTIAKVTVSHEKLLKGKGERMEIKLEREMGKTKKAKKGDHAAEAISKIPSKLVLRVRPATKDDVDFMTRFNAGSNKKKDNIGVYSDLTLLSPRTHAVKVLKTNSKAGGPGGEKRFRIKPFPDPSRAEQDTKWMTAKQIENETLKPSTAWVEAGSGTLGYLYLEVIACHNLPNMDMGVGGKTDSFVSCIFEDTIVNTDVINDELSPRWMPWTQRAFKLRIDHPSSQLFMGVFDYDNDLGGGQHDPIGRTAIDVTNLHEGMEYMLYYNLYTSTVDKDREPRGVLQVRVRLDYHKSRQALIRSMGPPPPNFVNVKRSKDFKKAFFVTNGYDNPNQFKVALLEGYVEELTQILGITAYFAIEAAKVIFLWRGTMPCCCGTKFPIHSLTAFVMGVCLVENYNLLPGFSLFCIAWFFLATMGERQQHPSPWTKTRTFWPFWGSFVTGRSLTSDIAENENAEAIISFEKLQKDKQEEQKSRTQQIIDQAEKINADLLDQEEERKKTEIGAKSGGKFSVNVLKPFLFPLQLLLHQVVIAVRVVRSIIVWDESYYAILITTACIFLGIGALFVPWGIIMRWTLRILVWVLLGPWMKLVDIFVVKPMEEQSAEDKLKAKAGATVAEKTAKNRAVMKRREEAFKLVAMKKYMFGKYIVRVPRFREYRLRDHPNLNSTAVHVSGKQAPVNVVGFTQGQHLEGAMVPLWGDMHDSAEAQKLRNEIVKRPTYGSV